MKDFGNIDYVTGAFPDAVANDSSGPTVRDGTPLEKAWVDELFGAFQAMLHYTGITASGTSESAADAPESVSSSQVVEAIRKMTGIPGEVTYFAGRDPDPLVHQGRMIQLAGQAVAVADYPDLKAATYCGDANILTASSFYTTNTPLGAPPSRDIGGTHLVLPDCRGKFLRSLNGTATFAVDIDRDLNSLNEEPGSAQLSQSGSHDHNVGWYDGSTVKILNNEQWYMSATYGPNTPDAVNIFVRGTTDITNGSVEGFGRTTDGGYGGVGYAEPTDVETRPQNIAFYAMIRY